MGATGWEGDWIAAVLAGLSSNVCKTCFWDELREVAPLGVLGRIPEDSK